MANTLYSRIKELCDKNNITISKLESDLSFGSSSIKKWEKRSSPSIDKILKVAQYFNVSTDYLLGQTDIEEPISDVLSDKDVISFQRARQNMSTKDKNKMMALLKIGFDYAFSDDDPEDK